MLSMADIINYGGFQLAYQYHIVRSGQSPLANRYYLTIDRHERLKCNEDVDRCKRLHELDGRLRSSFSSLGCSASGWLL